MDSFGKNRRAGGAVYELLTVDTSGDDEEVGKQEDQQPALPLVAKVKGKRRKHKSRSKVQNLELGAGSAEGEAEASSLGLGSGLVIGSSRDVLSFKDLILPRPDGILAVLPLEPRINVDSGDASKGAPLQDFSQEFPLESVGALESGQKSPPSSESLRNLATGVSRPPDLLLMTKESVEVRHMPFNLNLGPETRPAIVDSKIIDTSSIDGGFVSVSPNARLSGRMSPVPAGINNISGYSPRGGNQREPLFPELRQRTVEKLSDPPVQENGVDGIAMPTLTKVVSFKKQKPEADPSYLGHVDVIEQSPGFRAPPRLPLSSYETPHLTEWERLMVANSEYPTVVDVSPINYLRGEIQRGSMSERHSSAGIQQRRERIYNTMFHVPWRCELLIDVGFFVCLDSFLSLFTVMPARIIMFLWQRILHWR